MPRHDIYSGWSIDVPPDFSRNESDDGFVIFERPGHTIWSVVYVVSGPSPQAVLNSYLEGINQNASSEFIFTENEEGLVGYAASFTDTFHTDRLGFLTLIAARDCIARMDFEFLSPDDLSIVLASWRSGEYDQSNSDFQHG